MDSFEPSQPQESSNRGPAFLVNDELFLRYSAGAASPAERLLVEQILSEQPEMAMFVTQLRESHDAVNRGVTSNLARGRELLAARVGFTPNHLSITASGAAHQVSPASPIETSHFTVQTGQQTELVHRLQIHSRRLGLRALSRGTGAFIGLAVVALILLASIGVRVNQRNSHSEMRFQRYSTRIGQRAVVTLSDGSRVVLAPQAELIVASSFGRQHRTVSLVGEGYFTISPNAASPFLVRMGTVNVRVLGTAFDALYDRSTHDVRIAVATGRVAFGPRSIVLDANTLLTATDSTTTVQTGVDVMAYTEWQDGHLRFHNARVGDVLATVGRWYGVEFRLQDSTMVFDRVTAAFDYTTRSDVLIAIKTLLHVHMTFDGDTVLLHPSISQQATPFNRRSPHAELENTTEVGR